MISVLGPQHPAPNAPGALTDVEGPVALINAGWRHGEDDLSDVGRILGRDVVHVPLYRWFRQLLATNPEFASTYSARQERIREYKILYRIRMNAALGAVHQLQRRLAAGPRVPDLVASELETAVDAVRAIDDEMLEQLDAIRDEYPEIAQPWKLDAARERHEEARQLIDSVGAVCIAGGNVAVLRNRMHFYGLGELLEGRRIVCWSAGAMALCERIVLYYDDPPEGPSEAEVLGRGLGLIKGLVIFPHARRRLRLGSAVRIARLARRVAPLTCIAMENGDHLEVHDGRWRDVGRTAGAFAVDGTVGPVEVA